ncbi:hypothetical protein JCM8547_003344 [Rhodosporidiobolus lusitaniae]
MAAPRKRGPVPRTPQKGNTPRGANKFVAFDCFDDNGSIYCFCDRTPRLEAALRKTQKQNQNFGREFFCCDSPFEDCGFFLWLDEVELKSGKPYNPPGAGAVVSYKSSKNKSKSKKRGRRLADTDSDEDYTVEEPAEEEQEEEEHDWEGWEDATHLFRRTPSPPPKPAKNLRLLESPTSDLAALKKSGNGGRKRIKREESPEWPDPEEQQAELDKAQREIARLKRQVAQQDKVEEEVRALRRERDELLRQIYPGQRNA